MSENRYVVKSGIVGYKVFDNKQHGNVVAHFVGDEARRLVGLFIDRLFDAGDVCKVEFED